ncbi:heme/copper-type cytochrome/quinol oxidase subunit 2 [Cytobacillus eiseniae]|uniref:Heme/copper-type cytochrome/quinol oxidase subunit 2 n=1 Tax=Cytobacillus eiseniae TaxID=762947 RepID=A0ABS4RDY0_9BACI|nr:hypothetical protein [Cytobacillus eiseniae]MBP2240919.1 heme/copper-type cytochrome/quinol oxidase subunit 2 [Cytobacillus eiseniae]
MKTAIFFVILLTLLAVVLTLIFMSKGDQNYGDASKRNTTNLSLIYVVAILISIIALAIYIWLT